MQSETLNVINDLKLDMTASPVDDVTIITRAQLEALEAALSAAEPEVTGQQGRYWINAENRWSNWFEITFNTWVPDQGVREVRNLYAAPPAPSVAVKAVAPVDIYKAVGSFIDNDTFDKDHVSAICRAIASALSAQVQDVAGWRPIQTAPKDGTHILLFRARLDYGIDIATGWYAEERGWGGRGFIYPDWSQPTHWMPLPESPK